MSRWIAATAIAAMVVVVLLGLPLATALTLTAATGAIAATAPAVSGRADYPSGRADGRSVTAEPADVRQVLAWAEARVGDSYVMGANGPRSWDCSSFTRAAWAQAGVRLPRVAQEQRDWLAAGHGTRIVPGRERPGDLAFWDSYLGPRTIGHVVIVHDPTRRTTVEAHNTARGVGHFTYHPDHHRYEIWRPHVVGRPKTQTTPQQPQLLTAGRAPALVEGSNPQ